MASISQNSSQDSESASALNFPFLQDLDTVTFIKRSKVMILIKGLPGSGKSYLAREICKVYSDCVICSADNFRPPDLKYPYPKDVLTSSHKRCKDVAEEAAKKGVNVIVIDNSNLRLWEMQPYLKLAQEYNYTEIVTEPKTRWKWNPVELAAKSTQGVPKDVIQDKLKRVQSMYPFFYAWFVNEPDSIHLRGFAERKYNECLEQSQFVEEFEKNAVPGAPRTAGGAIDLKKYFSAQSFDTGPVMLHCTAFYSDHGEVKGSKEYAMRQSVEKNLGTAYKLQAIGLLITPRSLGFRLKLNDKEVLLWNNDDDGKVPTPKDPAEWVPSKYSPTSGPGCRAHLSIGVGVDYKAVQTGIDLVELVQDELDADAKGKKDFLTIKLDKAEARCYGNGNWLVYFDEPVPVETLYTGYY